MDNLNNVRVVLWLLYFTVLAYNVVDTLQTLILIDLGVGEGNPLINYFIELTGSNMAIWMVKVVPCFILGVLLFLYTKR